MGAQGTATVDFGAFPGKSDASVDVTGQTGILSTSAVEAWIRLEASADHSADEHMVETIKVVAGNIVAGVGFTIYALNTNQINEPLEQSGAMMNRQQAVINQTKDNAPSVGGRGTLIYGQWIVNWVWN